MTRVSVWERVGQRPTDIEGKYESSIADETGCWREFSLI